MDDTQTTFRLPRVLAGAFGETSKQYRADRTGRGCSTLAGWQTAILVAIACETTTSCADPPPQARTFWAIAGFSQSARDRGATFSSYELQLNFMPTAQNTGEAARVQPRVTPVDPTNDREPVSLNFQVPAGTYNVQLVFRGSTLCAGSRFVTHTLGTATVNGVVAPTATESARVSAMLSPSSIAAVCP
jgi:hypothetical protein